MGEFNGSFNASFRESVGLEIVDAVRYTEQELTDTQKEQARENIGAASQSELEVERARISNLASLDEGSTTGDAELAEIRVGYNGKTYPNAGEAVRDQVKTIHDRIGNVTTLSASNFVNGNLEPGTGVKVGNYYICTEVPVRIKVGDKVAIKPNGMHCRYFIESVDNFANVTTHIVDADIGLENVSFVSQCEGFFFMHIRGANWNALSPEDFVCEVSIGETHIDVLEERMDAIDKKLDRIADDTELLNGSRWWLGFYYSTRQKETTPNKCSLYTGSCDPVEVIPGEKLTITYIIPLDYVGSKWFALNLFDKCGVIASRLDSILTDYETVDGKAVFTAEYTIPDGIYSISASARSFAKGLTNPDASATDADVAMLADMVFLKKNSVLDDHLVKIATEADEGDTLAFRGGKWVATKSESVYANPNVKAINHRGYNSVAPENTLSAYRLSKKKGFEYVECDVKFTADKVPVLLHDATVDRTSNGTGNIADMTFADARALDFGGWKSAEYAGEKIPSFEEFIILCKRIGLHPYIHFEYPDIEDVENLVSIVKRNGMHKKVTWTSFAQGALATIKSFDEYARVGLLRNVPNETANENTIDLALSLMGDKNEVFINIAWNGVTAEFATLCSENDIPLEVWSLDHKPTLVELDTYVSGITSDTERANVTLYDEFG